MLQLLCHIKKRYYGFIINEKQTFAIIGLLLLLLLAVYSISLHFKPAQGDDLRLLTSMSDTTNPFSFFVNDAGEGKAEYRPLFSIPLWFAYNAFGIRASINQLINLALHFANVVLLLRVMRRVQSDNIILFLLAAIFLVSINTVSPASWVADRPTALVGFLLLLMIDYLLVADHNKSSINILYIATISFLALLSKESGLIVLIFVLTTCLSSKVGKRMKAKIFIVLFGVFTYYFCLRSIAFKSLPISQVNVGYGPGIIYDNWISAISPEYKFKEGFITVITNLASTFLPIFTFEGQILPSKDLIKMVLIWLPTMLIFCLSYSRKLSTLQKYSVVVIVANSVVHCIAFRYRLQYLSWLAACLFVAGSAKFSYHVNRKLILIALTFVLLLSSTYLVNKQLHNDWLRRYEALNRDGLRREIYDHRLFGRIDPKIVEQILYTYKGDSE
jgi:hypothetical protein